MYIYDTNSLSELTKRKPNIGMKRFAETVEIYSHPVFISIITVGEIIKGIKILERRNDFAQAKRYQNWLDNDIAYFVNNALPCDENVIKIWGELLAINPQNEVDKLIASTAIVHDFTLDGFNLATRNTKHIIDTPVKFINPFE